MHQNDREPSQCSGHPKPFPPTPTLKSETAFFSPSKKIPVVLIWKLGCCRCFSPHRQEVPFMTAQEKGRRNLLVCCKSSVASGAEEKKRETGQVQQEETRCERGGGEAGGERRDHFWHWWIAQEEQIVLLLPFFPEKRSTTYLPSLYLRTTSLVAFLNLRMAIRRLPFSLLSFVPNGVVQRNFSGRRRKNFLAGRGSAMGPDLFRSKRFTESISPPKSLIFFFACIMGGGVERVGNLISKAKGVEERQCVFCHV